MATMEKDGGGPLKGNCSKLRGLLLDGLVRPLTFNLLQIEHNNNSSSVLTKQSVGKDDGGTYSCLFDFGVFQAHSATDVYIHCKFVE